MRRTVVRALDTTIAVGTDHDEVQSAVDAIVGTFADAHDDAEVEWVLDAAHSRVLRDGRLVRACADAIDLAPFFEHDLYDVALARAEPSFVLHAAAVANDDSALLLVGPSGAGKSTMTRALLARGARYLTDEFAAVDGDLRVRGLSRPLVDEGTNAAFDPEADRLRCTRHTYRYRVRGGGEAIARVLHPSKERLCHERVILSNVVMLRHAPNEEPRLRPLIRTEALEPLWAERRRSGADELARALELVRRVPVFELTTRSVARAVEDLARIWAP